MKSKYLRILGLVVTLMALILTLGVTSAQDGKIVRVALGPGDIPGIDPALATDSSSIAVITEIYPSLTRLNETTAVLEPGMASSWEASDDGLTLTFHLLENVSWVKYNADSGAVEQVMDADGNPRMLTAGDFKYGMLRSMDPRLGSYYGGILATWVEGGRALNTIEIAEDATDEATAALVDEAMANVQIDVIDDLTLELTITQPAAFVTNIIGMWMAAAQPQWLIEEQGDLWTEPENIATYGPFVVSEWLHDESLTVVKNPFWVATESIPAPALDAVQWVFLDASAAFANYEADLLEVVSVPLSEMDRVKADADLSTQLHISPSDCTYYYGFNTTVPPFDDVRVRQAFSMTIDRQSLIDNILKGDQEPAYFFSRQDMLVAAPRAADYPDLALSEDTEAARALLQSYLDDNGGVFPQAVLMHNESEAHATIAAAIQEMWRNAFEGIIDANDIQVQTQEWAVYLSTVRSADTAPGIWRLGWCSDYLDAHNFLFDVWHSDVSEYGTGWTSDEFDSLLEQAMVETDTAVRTDLYSQAEYILTNRDAVIMPIYFYTSVSLTQPYVERTFAVGAANRYEKWDISQ
jgi:oligopeptide transport system substrate-binding protein